MPYVYVGLHLKLPQQTMYIPGNNAKAHKCDTQVHVGNNETTERRPWLICEHVVNIRIINLVHGDITI